MAARYWVGGTANWDGTAGTKWATTSGGAGGASVPTSADDVFFDAASGAVTVTVSAIANCRALTFTGFTGTFAGSSSVQASNNVVVVSGMTWTHSGSLTFLGGVTQTLTTNGKSITSPIVVDGSSTTLSLADAFTTTSSITVTRGTFTTNNYNVTATSLSSSNSNTRAINLGSSTVTLSGGTPIDFTTSTNLTFNAGTSSIVSTVNNCTINGGGKTFYNVTRNENLGQTGLTLTGANTFNNLVIGRMLVAAARTFILTADQTINGTLTISAGADASRRTFVQSNTIGTPRTLTCAAVASLTDIDFRDIAIAGTAAPVSGTRLGDCKGNSGITFDAPKTVYWNLATGGNWQATAWATTGGGTPAANNFPLAQDTAVFQATGLNSGSTISITSYYNIGTIDMSARTSNTMTLACSQSPAIYGNWVNGTGTTLTGTGTLTFAGRGSQTITSAGKTFTQLLSIETPGGSVTLQDALTCDRNTINALQLESGTLDANDYNITLSGATSGFNSDTSNTRTFDLGSGTLTIAGAGSVFDVDPSTNLTVTGTGTISLTSASAKTFAGGGIQTYPTLNQGGTGTLTVTGSNKFAGLTSTAIGRIQFTGGTTNEFTSFVINGASGNLLQLGSTNTTQVTLRKTGAWNVGANSTNGGNNTGLSFTAGDMDYLSVSYVNGEVIASTGTFNLYFGSTNIQDIYYGSAPVTAIYYGSMLVFQK